jgi:undecaprenyl phosphate N,N'-diacetylbacillosamine 1-phosphate transferase
MYKIFIKTLIDRVLALVVLLAISPIFLIVMISLMLAYRGNPFFYQKRPGRNEKIFKIVKFKSMNDAKDADGKLLPDALRLTRLGSLIRKTSLDEIPQLINVVKGDMSLVGPRPLLLEYLQYYTEEEKLRHTVRPGITGLAQINGRNNLDWEARLALDVEYVKNIEFFGDVKIMFQTIRKALMGKDIVVIPGEQFGKLSDKRKVCN